MLFRKKPLEAVDPASPPLLNAVLTKKTQQKLVSQVVNALQEHWSVAPVVQPLTQEEENFIRTFPVQYILSVSQNVGREENFLKDFIIGVLKTVVTQLATQAIISTVTPQEPKLISNHGPDETAATVAPDLPDTDDYEIEDASDDITQDDTTLETEKDVSVAQENQPDHEKSTDTDTDTDTHILKQATKDEVKRHITEKAGKTAEHEILKHAKATKKAEVKEISKQQKAAARAEGKRLNSAEIKANRRAANQAHLEKAASRASLTNKLIKHSPHAIELALNPTKEGVADVALDIFKDKLLSSAGEAFVKYGFSRVGNFFMGPLGSLITAMQMSISEVARDEDYLPWAENEVNKLTAETDLLFEKLKQKYIEENKSSHEELYISSNFMGNTQHSQPTWLDTVGQYIGKLVADCPGYFPRNIPHYWSNHANGLFFKPAPQLLNSSCTSQLLQSAQINFNLTG
jgi:hypothetical protein